METRFLDADTKKIIMFKSYYVVWKLFMRWSGRLYILKFKSYYVVWKLGNADTEHDSARSLNRTM